MATLAPAPSSLGLWSPALAPWFSTDVSLPAPDDTLAVSLTGLTADWLPPARGLLTIRIAAATRPPELAGLRRPDGTAAFADGARVALFTLLSEVEERLFALSKAIPSVAGTSGGTVATRPRVRALALELPASVDLSALAAMVAPAATGSDADKAEALGLTGTGSALANAATPMRDMKAPRFSSGTAQEKLLTGASLGNVKLWAFDALGHAVDPGAVAAWWSYLATTAFDNLWVADVGSTPRTATAAAALTAALVNAHGGPLADPVLSRLDVGNASGTGLVRTRGSASGALTVGFTAAPVAGTPDAAPVPRAALLPDGRYGASASAWPGGAVHTSLARDFARIAAVDVEQHLVGQSRTADGGAPAPARRRAADQERASTRTPVARTPTPVLLATTDEVASAATAALAGGGTVGIVAGVLDHDWGPFDLAAHPLPAVDPPAALAGAVAASALTGGGAAPGGGGVVTAQQILLDVNVGGAVAGAFVRVWSQGFDSATGLHYLLDGGAGRVGTDGHALLVAGVADGTVDAEALLGFDVLVVTANGSRRFADQRCARPAPIGGSPVAVGSAGGDVLVCETGVSGPGTPSAVPPGATLVARSTPPALIDRASLPVSALATTSLRAAVPAGAAIALTAPAFVRQPDGDTASTTTLGGASVHRQTRHGLDRLGPAGAPLPTMERLELVVARAGASDARAVVGSTPALSRYHELLPHQLGHPGAPAALEIHGAGATLSGPAAIQACEYARGRTAGDTVALAQAAFSSAFTTPADPPAPSAWAAVLATVAAEVEAESGVAELVGDGTYTFGGTLADIRSALSSVVAIPSGLDAQATSVARALDRRVLAAARGLREGATAMRAAIARAEDFVYLETPALDALSFGATDDTLDLLGTLGARMDARPGLRVVLCIPLHGYPWLPNGYNAVRDRNVTAAVTALRTSARAARVALFSPGAGPGRSLRLASTTLVVDDAFALTGTTHPTRRGLSFDSSLAVAVFDETLDDGRPAEVRSFRRRLLAGRLGLRPELLPDDPADLVEAVRTLAARGGGPRLAHVPPTPPAPAVPGSEDDVWDRDGSPTTGFNPVQWLLALAADVQAQLTQDATPAP